MNARRALAHLRKVDPKLAKVIDRVGPYRFKLSVEGTHFDAVVRAIVFQQLSGKAATTIHGRLLALHGGQSTPQRILASTDEQLRGVGLSRGKVDYLRDLSARCVSGELPIDSLHDLDDAAIMEALVKVRGIGPWTAQMFLMFRLGRPDVLPVLDLGIQNAIQKAYRLRTRPTPKRVAEIGKRWSPWSTVASWYLWRSLGGPF